MHSKPKSSLFFLTLNPSTDPLHLPDKHCLNVTLLCRGIDFQGVEGILGRVEPPHGFSCFAASAVRALNILQLTSRPAT